MTPIVLHGCTALGDETAWCVISHCEQFRYLLGRRWDQSLPMMGVDMFNPSTATHEKGDRTVDKCILIAKQEGFGGILVRNMGAYRSTDPDALLVCADPVGPLNLDVLAMELTPVRVAAWGRIPNKIAVRLHVPMWRAITRCTHVFAWTERSPHVGRHPLYLPNATKLLPIGAMP
jgi:hypothetical protein